MGLLRRECIGFSNGRLAYDDIISRTCVALEIGTLRQHINNEVVERYYRSSESSSDTLQAVLQSGETLLRQIESSDGRVRFNKGTFQTWLIYCSWSARAAGPLPETLLSRFEEARLLFRRGMAFEPMGGRAVRLDRRVGDPAAGEHTGEAHRDGPAASEPPSARAGRSSPHRAAAGGLVSDAASHVTGTEASPESKTSSPSVVQIENDRPPNAYSSS